MSGRAKTGPGVSRRGWFGLAVRALVSACVVLALRWPLPVFRASLFGEGAIDGTIFAFLASFALGVLGLPGVLVALWGQRPEAGVTPSPWWMRAGLVATLASSLTTGAWIAVSVREIGATLSGLEVAAQSIPIAVAAITSVVLRIRVARVTEH